MAILDFFKRKAAVRPAVKQPKPSKVRAGIAFGAGGTRGYAHIGVIRALEEHGIDFQYVSGCSAGSLAAALYCYGMNSYEMERAMREIRYEDLRSSRILFFPSKSKSIEDLVKKLIGDTTFEQLNRPLALIAVDLKTGEEIILNYGELAKACSASCAVPGVFTPVEYGEFRLVDGGLTNPVPADILRVMGAQKVISIDIHSGRGFGTDSTKILDVLRAAFRIGMKSTAIKGIVNSDVIIQPDCHQYNQTKLEHMDEMIEEGYRAAMEKMDEIKELLGMEKRAARRKSAPPALLGGGMYTPAEDGPDNEQ